MTKKLICIALMAALLLILAMSTAYAQVVETQAVTQIEAIGPGQGKPGGGGRQDGAAPPTKPDGDATRPQRPDGDDATPPALPENGDTTPPDAAQRGQRGNRQGGEPPQDGGMLIDAQSVRDALAAVTDADTLAQLQALLTAYETALEAERAALDASETTQSALTAAQQATEAARTALQTALEAQGITITPPTPPEGITLGTEAAQ